MATKLPTTETEILALGEMDPEFAEVCTVTPPDNVLPAAQI